MKRLKLEELEPRKQLTGLNAASPKHAFLNLHVAEWSMGAKAYAVLTVMYPVFLQIWSKRSCKQERDLKSQDQFYNMMQMFGLAGPVPKTHSNPDCSWSPVRSCAVR